VGEGAKRVTTGAEEVIGRLEKGRRARIAGADLIARDAAEPSAERAEADAPTWRRLWTGVQNAFAAQLERWPLWTPVAFGGGCAVYFALTFEPSAWAVFGGAALAAALAVAARRAPGRGVAVTAALFAAFVLGLAAAELRAERAAAPVAPAHLGARELEAWVLDNANNTGDRGRVLLAPVWIDGLRPEQTPVRMRLTLRGPPPAPGSAIRVLALVNPPPAPASPGAYDFARDAYFQGVGAVGLALGQPEVVDAPRPPWGLRWTMAINAWRWSLAQKIVARIGDRYGGIVVSMTTGHQAWIRAEDLQSFRDSGLAHLLSISGVHMAIVGGFVFFLTRLLIAAWPWLALRVPGKKVAAAVGIAAVCGYLVVAGSPAPAERSAVTAVVAFGAILLDRRAISFNSLAVAAFFVLARHPEQIVQPGFQMSFAATAALVALAEVWPHRTREISAPWPIVLFQRLKSWVVAGFMVSLVAGAATGPFAIQHFNRTANYGLLANSIESPISSFVTLPALAVGALLEALGGWGKPLLTVAGWGVRATLAVSDWVAKLPGAIVVVPSAPAIALPVSFLGLLFACLWKGRARWAGLPVAAAVLIWPRAEPPQVWIASDGTNAVVRDGRQAVVLRPDAKAFAVDLWTKRRGLAPAGPEALSAHFDCDRKGCAPTTAVAGVKVGAWWWRKPPPEDRVDALCRSAELVVFRGRVDRLPPSCARPLVLDAFDFERGGAVELWRRNGRWLALWSRDVRGERPWTRAGAPPGEDGG
jgi:competence protein ComEC